MCLSTSTRNEYSGLLIAWVELNQDKSWLEYFYQLKRGKDLPGGGMGSLNDWSPSYQNETEYAWFNLLYRITHKLLTEKMESDFIKDDFLIQHRNEVNILECKNCHQKFQHPHQFEEQIAAFYYFKNFSKFVKQKRLKDFTNPNFSYRNIEARKLREILESEYMKNDIILFDFLKSHRICQKCNTKMEFEYVDYQLNVDKIAAVKK